MLVEFFIDEKTGLRVQAENGCTYMYVQPERGGVLKVRCTKEGAQRLVKALGTIKQFQEGEIEKLDDVIE